MPSPVGTLGATPTLGVAPKAPDTASTPYYWVKQVTTVQNSFSVSQNTFLLKFLLTPWSGRQTACSAPSDFTSKFSSVNHWFLIVFRIQISGVSQTVKEKGGDKVNFHLYAQTRSLLCALGSIRMSREKSTGCLYQSGPSDFECSYHRRMPRPSVGWIRRKFSASFWIAAKPM